MRKSFDILNPYDPADDIIMAAGSRVRCSRMQDTRGKREISSGKINFDDLLSGRQEEIWVK